ncbi:MAG TPA: ribose-phosphate diphosphokinase, partial [Verrucomicrobiales bacterium]|nr:ribose-phosphate diphosphokinase [Verrucomicrobiales bacterium]
AKLVANLIEAAGVDRVLTMDLHAAQVQGFFDIPVDHLYAKPVLLKHLRKQRNGSDREITVVSPDVGGVKIARSYADALGAELAIVAKQRISATVVEAMKLIGEVEGRDAIIVDDMTETAGTLCAAAETLKNNGAGRIYAGVSHAVLGDLGCERIMSSDIDEVITTDSTPLPPEACRSKVSTLTVAGLLGEAIQRIHNGKSVSSLFDIEGGSV